jgi:hypothetical protein
LQLLEKDGKRGDAYAMVWERVLEHVRNGEIIVYDYETNNIQWFDGLSHA